MREEKLEMQRLLQEERVQRALERAKAPIKKKLGKPIPFRSAPPQKKEKKTTESKKKEEGMSIWGLFTVFRGQRLLLVMRINSLVTRVTSVLLYPFV